jgi:hypothetical protein
MLLHTVWNVVGDDVIILKAAVLGVAAWFITWGLVQQGLHQIRHEQAAIQTVGDHDS